MKKIVKRRKMFRVNNPLAFGILCAMILILIGGSVYALAVGLAMPAVKNYQNANLTPSPSSEPPVTATPSTIASPPTPEPGTTPESEPTPEGGLLAGYVIGIDPARGYSSKIRGAYTGIYANRLNYAVAVLVTNRLEEMGAKVIVPLADVKDDMESSTRASILNQNEVAFAIRIECNFVETAETRGTIMWTNGNHARLSECDKLATAIHAAYIAATEMPVQKYDDKVIRHKNDDTFLQEVKAPVCTLIMGYISNEKDDKLLNDEEFQKKVADSLVAGIFEYLGIKP